MLSSHPSKNREKHAEAIVADLFESHGWEVLASSAEKNRCPDLIVQRGTQCFVIEIKALAEGRADRVIPLLSQSILVAQANTRDVGCGQPLAVICVENASQSLLKQVSLFFERYAPNVAVGIISEHGLRYFQGGGLEDLNAEPEPPRSFGSGISNQAINIFSDLNQWMLKVLLAPEIPDHLLEAPRLKYRSVSELAEAAKVSNMSASRFLQQLRNEGFLDESSRYVTLVRRAELFRRWRSVAMRFAPERPMRFLIRGNQEQQIRSLFASHDGEAVLGLFAAADALQLGHVSGVPPFVYVPKLPQPGDKNWKVLLMASPSEAPHLILRQALSPQSTLRGAVHRDGLIVSDVIQIWLDVANHPSRGEEQANLIYQKLLRPIIDNGN